MSYNQACANQNVLHTICLPSTTQFKDREWFFLDDLIKCDQAYFYGCLKQQRKALLRIPDNHWMFVKMVKGHLEDSHEGYARAKVLVTKDWAETNVPNLMSAPPTTGLKMAPPILHLNEDEMFRNVNGTIVHVDVRGTRNKDDIFFKCADVAALFEMESLVRNIARDYIKDEHVVEFLPSQGLPIDDPGRLEVIKPQSVYFFTYPGLIEVIFRSRSGVAHRFKNWANSILFIHHLGSSDQKEELVSDLQEQLNEMKRHLAEAQKAIEEANAEAQKARQDAEFDRQHALRLQEMMVSDEKLEATQVIYIATSKNYAAQNRFKVGGVESLDKLKGRLHTYNSRSAQGDDFYYSDTFVVVDYHTIESRLKSLVGRFRDRKSKEIYIMHYSNIRYLVQFLCDHYTDEMEEVNHMLGAFIGNLNQRLLRPYVPAPKELTVATATVVDLDAQGHVSVRTITTDDESFVEAVEEMVRSIPEDVTEVTRKEVMDRLNVKTGRKEKEGLVADVISKLRPGLRFLKRK